MSTFVSLLKAALRHRLTLMENLRTMTLAGLADAREVEAWCAFISIIKAALRHCSTMLEDLRTKTLAGLADVREVEA
ncbi:MAG: hypothetical protein ACI4XW_02650 [Candidatus Spyradocola sp.]